jgi:hypothetical protein
LMVARERRNHRLATWRCFEWSCGHVQLGPCRIKLDHRLSSGKTVLLPVASTSVQGHGGRRESGRNWLFTWTGDSPAFDHNTTDRIGHSGRPRVVACGGICAVFHCPTGSTRLWLALASYPPTTQPPAFLAFPPDCAIMGMNENIAQRVAGHQLYTNHSGAMMQRYSVRGQDT